MDFKARTATLEGFDGLLVSVEGGLGIATARTLAEPAELALGASCPLVLDLSKCSSIDWMGLPFVLRAHEALAEVGEAMALVTDHALIRKMLFLTGIDRCEVDRAIEAGDVIRFVVTLDANFGGTFRFTGSGAIDGVEVIRGRFYLASPPG